MAITFELPTTLEQELRRHLQNLDAEAKEAFLVDLYRRGLLTHVALSQTLALDRVETEEVLHKHNVTEDLATIDDYLADIQTLERLRTRGR